MTQTNTSGKLREIVDIGNGALVLITTDEVFKYGEVFRNNIGVLNRTNAFWLNFTEKIVRNNIITVNNADMPVEFRSEKYKNRCIMVERLRMLKVEAFVAGYLTDAVWDMYAETGEVGEIILPTGLSKNEKLELPIFVPMKKDEDGNREFISINEMEETIGEKNSDLLKYTSLHVYSKCAKEAESKGIIVGDARFKFGYNKNGKFMLANNLLMPDNSHMWMA